MKKELVPGIVDQQRRDVENLFDARTKELDVRMELDQVVEQLPERHRLPARVLGTLHFPELAVLQVDHAVVFEQNFVAAVNLQVG